MTTLKGKILFIVGKFISGKDHCKTLNSIKNGLSSDSFIRYLNTVKIAQLCLTLCDGLYSPGNSLGQNMGVGSL